MPDSDGSYGLKRDDVAGPQFGEAAPGLVYPVRRGAHGVALNEQGLVALVRIGEAKGAPEHDLPGGGVDPGERDEDAMIREFMEETGLPVQAGQLIARAQQYWRKDKITPRNSHFAIFEAIITGAAGRPSEPYHCLEWVSPQDAIDMVRHEAHAWALRLYFSDRGI